MSSYGKNFFFKITFVIITDNEDPVISNHPSNMKQSTDTNLSTAIVMWTSPTASDNSGLVTLTSSNQPGDTFPIGVTPVTYTAVDPSNNKVIVGFTVAVLGRFGIKLSIPHFCLIKKTAKTFVTICDYDKKLFNILS